jgi:peptidase E
LTKRHIVASSGGFVQTDRWGVVKPGQIFNRALELTGKTRPRVLFVLTASGDNPSYLATSYQAVSGLGVDVEHLALFTQPNVPVEEAFGRADLVWVGGGSVANLLALWQLHGVDAAAKDAWNRGVVLGGVSAGSICWHVGGPTDSFGPKLETVTNGLALLPYGNGVHYDTEAQRRPLLHSLVSGGTLPMSFATDDHAALVYEGTNPIEVVVDTADSKAKAYRVEVISGEVNETVLEPGSLA